MLETEPDVKLVNNTNDQDSFWKPCPTRPGLLPCGSIWGGSTISQPDTLHQCGLLALREVARGVGADPAVVQALREIRAPAWSLRHLLEAAEPFDCDVPVSRSTPACAPVGQAGSAARWPIVGWQWFRRASV
jgi:hypothetical protein